MKPSAPEVDRFLPVLLLSERIVELELVLNLFSYKSRSLAAITANIPHIEELFLQLFIRVTRSVVSPVLWLHLGLCVF